MDAVRGVRTSAAVLFAVIVGFWLSVANLALGHGAASGQTQPGQTSEWTFDRDPVGGLPQGTVVFSGRWAVRAEAGTPPTPNALCQTGTTEFSALALSDMVYTDASIETSFKPISGHEDRAAGIIFRIQDKDNYYIVRANALEDNINTYKYVRGRRIFLKGMRAKVLSGTWQRLGAVVHGPRIRSYLNGQLMAEVTDETFKAGKVGLWTKADSLTCFDNVRVAAAP